MEDKEPISAAGRALFCVELMKLLNLQRKQNCLCDITLVTNDDREFNAHRNVLSAASPFFCKLLQSDMKENHDGIIRFEEISRSVMEDVLEFIYTGTVKVTRENAKELIAAGNFLIIPSLKIVSGRFLEREMSYINCISTFYLAEKFDCDELITNSRRFIEENIVSVAKMDEFLHLEAKEIERWISSDVITVKEEADVFKLILDWVNFGKNERKAAFEELFCHVRLGFLSRDCLKDVVTNEFVRDSAVCLRLTSDASMKMATYADEDDFLQSPRKGHDTRIIVARGGKYTFCYLPEEDLWKRLPDGREDVNASSHHMIKFRDQLLTFSDWKNSERYDPLFNVWCKLGLRAGVAKVAVLKGEIYAFENNYLINPWKNVTKKYNAKQCTWETLDSSPGMFRYSACVVAAGSHLYVFGGSHQGHPQNIAEAKRFDTLENKWEKIADMQEGRSNALGVASQDKIFVAGGTGRRGSLQTCEMYTMSTNEWQYVANLNAQRCHGSMVCLKGKLYVLGGLNEKNETELSVECFDCAKDQWMQKTAIPVAIIDPGFEKAFIGSVIKLSRELLDKLKTVADGE